MKKIIVPYVTEAGDLYYEKFNNEDQALMFIERANQEENKCLMIVIESSDDCNFKTKIKRYM